jgi:hypothetical protein
MLVFRLCASVICRWFLYTSPRKRILHGLDHIVAALAREMNTTEGALKVAVHRLRKRYRELFRQEIADTVVDPAEVESELRYLAAVLTRK